ncbi:hypothetical protein JCM6882_008629 [Rhodosporidiobolus microsporus]
MITRIPHSPLYRRRPPRRASSTSPPSTTAVRLVLRSCLLALLVCVGAVQAQSSDSTEITVPSTTSFNLSDGSSAFFSLPTSSLSLSTPLTLSLSLCAPPSSFLSSTSFTLPPTLNTALYVSTSSSLTTPGPDSSSSNSSSATAVPDDDAGGRATLRYGWANVTLAVDEVAAADGVWVGVFAPSGAELLRDQAGDSGGDDNDNAVAVEGQWELELDVREQADVDWVLDGGVGFRFEDSDASGVLLSTTNFTAAGEDASSASAPGWAPLVVETNPLSLALGRSRCFVRRMQLQAVAAAGVGDVKEGTTTRGYGGGARSQFEVRGLEAGRNYTAWLVNNGTAGEASASGNATRVWDPVFFQTKSSSSCRLLYDLDFCPSVAYSVPAPPSLDTASLIFYFNSSLSPSLAAFARTLTTFPCDVPSMGKYSVVSTCADCYAAYRDWACASTLPRCTDAPANATLNDTTTSALSSGLDTLATWPLPEEAQTLLVRADPFASRTPAFGPLNLSSTFPSLFNSSYPASDASNLAAESPFPYGEVPPCTDVCDLVGARCPPFLEWACPGMEAKRGATGLAGYGLTRAVEGSERVAGELEGSSSREERAGDRWGNVFCNALGTDLTSAAQFLSTTTSPTSAAPRALLPSFPLLAAILAMLLAFATL